MYVQVHAYLCVFDCMSVLVCMHACPLYVNLCEVKHETPQAKKKQQNKITTTTKQAQTNTKPNQISYLEASSKSSSFQLYFRDQSNSLTLFSTACSYVWSLSIPRRLTSQNTSSLNSRSSATKHGYLQH